jgi:hypothetical protein
MPIIIMHDHYNHQECEISVYNVLIWKSDGRDHQEDIDVDGSLILKWILRK